MQFGRIGNFGLLEMTRQRLRESSVKWNMVLSLDSFALKVIKKGEELAFSNKAKIVNINIPTKVKNYIDENLSKEINHFKKKYKLEFNVISDEKLVIPEYILIYIINIYFKRRRKHWCANYFFNDICIDN